MPGITNIPSNSSYFLIFFFRISGSIKEVKKEVVAKQLRATETLAYLIEP
jgi:hypothetical protein